MGLVKPSGEKTDRKSESPKKLSEFELIKGTILKIKEKKEVN